MSIRQICSRTTHLADLDENAQVAADRMRTANVGTLLVIDEVHRPIGILTDRDLATRIVAEGLDARAVKVEELMTAHPRWVKEDTSIDDAINLMRSLGVRRLPVVDKRERLVGILSVDDVLEFVTQELEQLGRVVGSNHPRVTVPAGPGHEAEQHASSSGLERSRGDIQC